MFRFIWNLIRSLSLRCPHCHQGKVMRNWLVVNPACPVCGYVFMKEQGDFWGGMIFSYTYAAVLSLALAGVLMAFHWLEIAQRVYLIAFAAVGFIILLHPVTRSNWITVMYLTRGDYPEYAPPAKSPPGAS
ncbi:MAG TPA: DUF983 domain-containing protein [bacterium]|nr:DUF983 domain-containing protein [bacterium]